MSKVTESMQATPRGSLSVTRERAMLVGVLLPDANVDPANPLAELAALAESAGAEVVDSLVQKRLSPHPGLFIGTGKAREVKDRADAAEATVIVFDNDLSPRQIRGLEEIVERKILDRSELILDIFASRARTHEARLQVELAQLEYTAPRLRGMWTHLERIAGAAGGGGAGVVGGIGTRGPGERQIEIDRRLVKDRILQLKREIEEIDRRKLREIRAREDEFTVSLVGYTNSGKTTLLNRLTGAEQFAKDMLFATLDTKTTRWHLGDGSRILLSDTVGFIRDLPHRLVASFRATLEEAIHADLLLHVVDAASPFALHQVESVNAVLAELGCREHPSLLLLNKVDAVVDDTNLKILMHRSPESLPISAKTGQGLEALVERVRTVMKGKVVETMLRVPGADGRAIADIERYAHVLSRTYEDSTVLFRVRANQTQLAQLKGRHAGLKEVAEGEAASA